MSQKNIDNYYLKYLKYKKKYHNLKNKRFNQDFSFSPIAPMIIRRSSPINSPIAVSSLPIAVTSSPILRSISPIFFRQSPVRFSPTDSSSLVISNLIRPTPIIGTSIVTSVPLSTLGQNYNEFNDAFDFFNKRFDENKFTEIFKKSYVATPVKTYKNKRLSDIIIEKNEIQTKLQNQNIFSSTGPNTFENLMNTISLKFINLNAKYQLQLYARTYVILDKISQMLN